VLSALSGWPTERDIMLYPEPFSGIIDAPPAPVRHGTGIPEHPRILAPEEVDIPLPKATIEEVAIPASINGRDLSRGQP
jgi:hypothetical protein